MTSATLRRARGDVITMARLILVTPSAISYQDALGAVRRQEWDSLRDRLEYPSPARVIGSLEAALARATGQSVELVRLTHGYAGDAAA